MSVTHFRKRLSIYVPPGRADDAEEAAEAAGIPDAKFDRTQGFVPTTGRPDAPPGLYSMSIPLTLWQHKALITELEARNLNVGQSEYHEIPYNRPEKISEKDDEVAAARGMQRRVPD